MPREDWATNNVQRLFEEAGLFPTGRIDTILDVACGLSLKSQYIDAAVRVGVDVYRPFLERVEASVPHALVNANALDLDKLFLPRSFDLVLLLDIVEHLPTADALRLLSMAEAIAAKAVIVETPRGFIPQNLDIWGHGGHEYQTHRSGWSEEDFATRGYRTLLRPYVMSDVPRHTSETVDPHIEMIDAILLLNDEG